MTYCTAASQLDPSDLVDLYWAGRCTLVTRQDHIAIYDRVFKAFFLGASGQVADLLKLTASASAQTLAVLNVPATEELGAEVGQETMLGLMASDAETWRHRAFGGCTRVERASARRIVAGLRLPPPKRGPGRPGPTSPVGSKPDLRRTVREVMRRHGDPAELYWRRRKVRL